MFDSIDAKQHTLRFQNIDHPTSVRGFEELKSAKLTIASAPVLVNPDRDELFVLILMHTGGKVWRAPNIPGIARRREVIPDLILFIISRTLTDAETRYSATELECRTVVWRLHQMEHFVDGVNSRFLQR
jgi:hypothetical protein